EGGFPDEFRVDGDEIGFLERGDRLLQFRARFDQFHAHFLGADGSNVKDLNHLEHLLEADLRLRAQRSARSAARRAMRMKTGEVRSRAAKRPRRAGGTGLPAPMRWRVTKMKSV